MIRQNRNPAVWLAPVLFVGAITFSGGALAASAPADMVLVNGKIYTVDDARPWAEALAIRDGKISKVGSTKDMKALQGPETKVIDLKGRMAMPGINDGHVHAVWGTMSRLYACEFPFTAGPDDIQAAIAACVAKNPEGGWIKGGQWDSDFFARHNVASPKELLDKVSKDYAVVLGDDSGHNAWANSKALELAGWDASTKDPAGGTIVRDPETGEPNGILLENAATEMEKVVPDWTAEEYVTGVRKMVNIVNGAGITGLKNANTRENELQALYDLDQAGGLSINFAACISTPYEQRSDLLDYDRIDRIRDQYASTNLHTSFVKIFLDGVPTPARSAAMLEPYEQDPAFPADERGSLHVQYDTLSKDLTELDKRGYTVKIHTAGDRSVRTALDAIETARQNNGQSGLRHELSHAGLISDADLPRFEELQAVADLSPYLWSPSPIISAVIAAIGDRGRHYWPIRTLVEINAPVLAGSDWPAAVPSINPWVGLEAMVTRKDPYGNSPGQLWPEQAISREQAIHIYTIDGAKALKMADQTGSIVAGKDADIIVLDQNLLDVPEDNIGDTKVLLTLFKGKVVHRADDIK